MNQQTETEDLHAANAARLFRNALAGITVRAAVGDAADAELCALPKGVHNYHIPLPEALCEVLHKIPCGLFLWDGECIVLTATTLDAEAMCDPLIDPHDETVEDCIDGANLR